MKSPKPNEFGNHQQGASGQANATAQDVKVKRSAPQRLKTQLALLYQEVVSGAEAEKSRSVDQGQPSNDEGQ